MATRNEQVNVTIKAQDKASKTLNNIKGAVIGMGAAYLGLRGVSATMGSIIEKGQEHEKVWNDVAASLKRHNKEVDNNLISIQKFSDEMQTLTGVSDEVVGKGVQAFIDYGASIEDAQANMRVAADLAAGSGLSMKSAVDLVAKAQVGYTSTLSRYGIILDESIPASEKFAAAIAQINEKFGGAAAARSETFAVKISLLSERFGDLQEQVFKLIAPGLLTGVEALVSAVGTMSTVISFFSPVVTIAHEEVAVLETEIKKLEDTRGSVEQIKLLKEELEGLKQAARDSANAILDFAATSDAVQRFQEMSAKIKEGIDLSGVAIEDLIFDFNQLPDATSDATLQLIGGLNQYALSFTAVGETAKLTLEEIAALAAVTDEQRVATTQATSDAIVLIWNEGEDELEEVDQERADHQAWLNSLILKGTLKRLTATFKASEKARKKEELAAKKSADAILAAQKVHFPGQSRPPIINPGLLSFIR